MSVGHQYSDGPPLPAPSCDACGLPIYEQGWIRVSDTDADDAAQKSRELAHEGNISMPLTDFLDVHEGREARWAAYHSNCEPNAEEPSYTVEIEALQSWPGLVDWMIHLGGKQWVAEDTDFLRFVERKFLQEPLERNPRS